MVRMDWFVGGLFIAGVLFFFWLVGLPLYRAIRDGSQVLPERPDPGPLGIDMPRRRS